jgi:L-aspartate oxidase
VSPQLTVLPAPSPTWWREADAIVAGTGAAGLSCALELAARGLRVVVLCKGGPNGGSTPIAQGGLAAVSQPDDSTELHLSDTIVAGAGLVEETVARELVASAPGAVAHLEYLGARLDGGPPSLEGGHSVRRVIHAGGDASGAEVFRSLWAATRRARIDVLTDTVALDALLDGRGRVGGLLVGRATARGGGLAIGEIRAGAVVLATGGFGQAYASTTNQPGATGDGLALALRAGAVVRDLEFVQFHPTVIFEDADPGQRPLVTEALRGAGAIIVDDDGRSVMAGRHPRADLAPRDVVSAAMHAAMTERSTPLDHLWLDARAVGRERLATEFPTFVAACRERGIDPLSDFVPVAPGAHYVCGGVRADLSGTTSVDGLFAVGEVANTGVHGANRLASNSLTEALIAGRRLGRRLRVTDPNGGELGVERAGSGIEPSGREERAVAMSRDAGVLRDAEGLGRLIDRLDAAPEAPAGTLDLAIVEATNLHTVSTLVAHAALAREESRGCHRRRDFPGAEPGWTRRLEWRLVEGRLAGGDRVLL